MKKLSFKGIIIGSITDIVSSNIFQIPLFVWITISLSRSGVSQEQMKSAIILALHDNASYFLFSVMIGGSCSILGGYVAAKIAKQHEVLNGTLASFLCIFGSLYTIFTGTSQFPLWQQIFFLLLSPVLTAFGGYLRSRQVIAQAHNSKKKQF